MGAQERARRAADPDASLDFTLALDEAVPEPAGATKQALPELELDDPWKGEVSRRLLS